MKNKMKKILASLTLGTVAIACVPVVNAASSVSGNVGGYSTQGTLTDSSDKVASATAMTSYSGYSGAIVTGVTLNWGLDGKVGTKRNSASGNRTHVIATAASDSYGSVLLSATGSHLVSAGSNTWSDSTYIN